MKKKNLAKASAFLSVFSIVGIIASSCTNVVWKEQVLDNKNPIDDYKNKNPINPNPPVSNPTEPTVPVDDNSNSIVDQANAVLAMLKPQDIVIENGTKNVKAKSLTPDKLSVHLDSKFDSFNQEFKIISANDDEGIVNTTLTLRDRQDARKRSRTFSFKLEGFSNKVNDVAIDFIDNFYSRDINIGDAKYVSFEDLMKQEAITTSSSTRLLEDGAKTSHLNNLFHEKFKDVSNSQQFFVEGRMTVNESPTKDEAGNSVVKLTGLDGGKITVTNNKAGDELIEFQINSITAINLKPSQLSVQLAYGDQFSTNNFNVYDTTSELNHKVEAGKGLVFPGDQKSNRGDRWGVDGDANRLWIERRFYRVGKDNLGVKIENTDWSINPLQIPYLSTRIGDYKIWATVKYGIDGKFVPTDAYDFEIFAKKVHANDYGYPVTTENVGNDKRFYVIRNTILTLLFSYIGTYRNNMNKFLEETIDRSKLLSFITYGDTLDEKTGAKATVDSFDSSKNTYEKGGNPMVDSPLKNEQGKYDDWRISLRDDVSTNYVFVVGLKSKSQPDAKWTVYPNMTFLTVNR
ncbi:hypothetical protein [Mycoplasma sp. E35C]|uniref:hypothetical protein n=1 Tax=Mycoplasma sp. E35C TaxID=2801918 RepID=UPI001CA44E87|nr:hypothetical protein [Mycoplasma sp. E35C]QZX48868.1 hypothetical protein JJE79_02305 [Mycoplasma sp. E35C]